jgi:predicted membrane protein
MRSGGVETQMVDKMQDRRFQTILPGVFLIVIGIVVLLEHMGVIERYLISKYWPLLLIALGISRMLVVSKRLFGFLLVSVGVVLQLNKLGWTSFSFRDLWPVALIGLGIVMIWGRFQGPKYMSAKPEGENGEQSYINEFALFGGSERRIYAKDFRNGNVTAILGGVEIDFRAAEIEGEQAVLYVEAILGGIEVSVPDRWTVVYEGQSIFGGFSDETRPPIPDVPGSAPKKTLILRGRAVFGGIVVKS